MNLYDLAALKNIYSENIYAYSFVQMMTYLYDNPGSVARSNGWRDTENYYFYTMTYYGQLQFNAYDKDNQLLLNKPHSCTVCYDLIENKYALYTSLDSMIEYLDKEKEANKEKVMKEIIKDNNND